MLQKIPPYFKDPRTKETVETAESVSLSSYNELKFWQAYRNQIVHSNGIASPKFFENWSDHYQKKRNIYPHLPQMKQSKPLPVHDDMFGTQAACFYRIAKSLSDCLEQLSGGKRGQVLLPEFTGEVPGQTRSLPLLMTGDHAPSLRWTHDAEYRSKIAAERGWTSYRPSADAAS
jgi:hypothetical protein